MNTFNPFPATNIPKITPKEERKNARYSTENAVYHVHNGVDAPKIPAANILGLSTVRSIGNSSRALNATAGTQTIAHGLGTKPTVVRINGTAAGGTAIAAVSYGIYYNGNVSANYLEMYVGTSVSGGTTGDIIYLAGGGSGQSATITVDSTNIYLAWSQVSGGATGTLYFTWEAEG